MAERIRVTGKNDGVNDNEAIDAQVDSTFDAIHVKSHLYGYDGVGFTRPLSVDGATNSMQIINYEHHEIHDGSHYTIRGVQDLTANKVLDFTWLMPNTTKWIHWLWNIDTESETDWKIYETVVATNPLANIVTPLNSDRNSTNTSGTTMKYEVQADLAAANADTNVTGATLISSGISGAGKTAGRVDRSHELIMKQNTLYCLRATASSAGYINFAMSWYEHTNKG